MNTIEKYDLAVRQQKDYHKIRWPWRHDFAANWWITEDRAYNKVRDNWDIDGLITRYDNPMDRYKEYLEVYQKETTENPLELKDFERCVDYLKNEYEDFCEYLASCITDSVAAEYFDINSTRKGIKDYCENGLNVICDEDTIEKVYKIIHQT